MKKIVFVVLLVLIALPAAAKPVIDLLPTSTFTSPLTGQQNFEKLVTDIGLIISYKPVAPSESLKGRLLPFGFDIGIEGSLSKIDKNEPYWQSAIKPGSGNLSSSLYFTKVHAQVGLPVIPIEFGVVYGKSPNIDMEMAGVELKYLVLKGDVVLPAIALRGAYSELSGVSALDIKTYQADVSISKGILMVTPYAGVGEVWIKGKNKDRDLVLQNVSTNEFKSFVGIKIAPLPILNVVAEGEFAQVNTYSLRLNLSF